MSHISLNTIFGQSGEACGWRVCYQQGLPRLVFLHNKSSSGYHETGLPQLLADVLSPKEAHGGRRACTKGGHQKTEGVTGMLHAAVTSTILTESANTAGSDEPLVGEDGYWEGSGIK